MSWKSYSLVAFRSICSDGFSNRNSTSDAEGLGAECCPMSGHTSFLDKTCQRSSIHWITRRDTTSFSQLGTVSSIGLRRPSVSTLTLTPSTPDVIRKCWSKGVMSWTCNIMRSVRGWVNETNGRSSSSSVFSPRLP